MDGAPEQILQAFSLDSKKFKLFASAQGISQQGQQAQGWSGCGSDADLMQHDRLHGCKCVDTLSCKSVLEGRDIHMRKLWTECQLDV